MKASINKADVLEKSFLLILGPFSLSQAQVRQPWWTRMGLQLACLLYPDVYAYVMYIKQANLCSKLHLGSYKMLIERGRSEKYFLEGTI